MAMTLVDPIESTRIASPMEKKIADSEIQLETRPAPKDCFGCVDWFPYYLYSRDAIKCGEA
jgi:hypothetical protein